MSDKTLSEKLEIFIKQSSLQSTITTTQAKIIFLCGLVLLKNRQFNLDQFDELNTRIIDLLKKSDNAEIPYDLALNDKKLHNLIIMVYNEMETINMDLHNEEIEYMVAQLFQYLDKNKSLIEDISKKDVWQIIES